MTKYNFNVGARVHCKDGVGGKLIKVILNPQTQQVTDLVIQRGYLLTTDCVLPITVVEQASGSDVILSISRQTLGEYSEHREGISNTPTLHTLRSSNPLSYRANQ